MFLEKSRFSIAMSWIRRFNNIRQRDWADVANYWAEFGRDFDTADFLRDSLEDAIESIFNRKTEAENTVQIVEIEQRRPFVSELVYSQIKANHALMCAAQQIASGSSTWGVTDAYHSSMLLMRSILAAFGVFVCRVQDRNILIDAFPWFGRIDDQKKFKRRHRNWEKCAAVISCTSQNFGQSDLYSLFQRVLTVSTVPSELWPEAIVRNLIATSKSHFSSSRNRLIYGSRFWFQPDDLLGECLSIDWMNPGNRSIDVYDFAKTTSSSEIDCYCDCWVLFRMSRKLHEAIYQSLANTLDVFGYVDVRRGSIRLIERQFS